MWDGRIDSLQRQVLSVIESPLEGNSSRLFFAQEIARRYGSLTTPNDVADMLEFE
jgi:hypothetical protein